MSQETLIQRQAEGIHRLYERIKDLERIPELVAKIGRDEITEDLAEDAFLEVGFMLLAGEVSDFLCGAATPHGDYRRWEWAAAYLLHVGAQCVLAHETHPLTLDELTARHGELAPDVDQIGPVIQGIRYERHETLPAWRQVDGEVCEAHGLPVRDSVDWETGEASRDCVRCFREGAGA